MDHLKFKQERHNLQADLEQLKEICGYLYHKYCPSLISNRRNIEHTQVSEIQILALLCLQMTINMQSQRKFFAWAKLSCLSRIRLPLTALALIDGRINFCLSSWRCVMV